MATDNFRYKLFRPEIFLQNLLVDAAKDNFVRRGENNRLLYRAIVLAVDTNGGKLENEGAQGNLEHKVGNKTYKADAQIGPSNPANSIKARVITDGTDRYRQTADTRVFWPFFPESISIPIKPGEHVYVIFEDEEFKHGLWISKIPGHEGANYSSGEDFIKDEDENSLSNKFADTKGLKKEKEPVKTNDKFGETKDKDVLKKL